MPLTGIRYDPFAYEMHEDPYPTYRVLRDEQPVYRQAERDFWALSRHDDVQAAARDWETFSSADGVDLDRTAAHYGQGSFIDMDPPSHDVLRKAVREWFTPTAIKQLEPVVRATAIELLDGLDPSGDVDLADALAWPLPMATVCDMLGVARDDRPWLLRALAALQHRLADDDRVPPPALAALREVRAYFADLAASRAKAPHEDLLSHLLTTEVGGRSVADDAVGVSMLLLVAGVETAAGLMSSLFSQLGADAELRHRLAHDPELIPAATEEMLRLESPIQGLTRLTTRDVVLHDVEVPAGSRVFLLFGSANRDDRAWSEPDRLLLDRPRQRHLAFGEGIHFCLGAPLARLEARIVFEEFLSRHRDYELTGPRERLHSHTTRGFTELGARLG